MISKITSFLIYAAVVPQIINVFAYALAMAHIIDLTMAQMISIFIMKGCCIIAGCAILSLIIEGVQSVNAYRKV